MDTPEVRRASSKVVPTEPLAEVDGDAGADAKAEASSITAAAAGAAGTEVLLLELDLLLSLTLPPLPPLLRLPPVLEEALLLRWRCFA